MKKSILVFTIFIVSMTAVFAMRPKVIVHKKLQALPIELIKKEHIIYPYISERNRERYKINDMFYVRGKHLIIWTAFTGSFQEHIFKLFWTGKKDSSGETALYLCHSIPRPDNYRNNLIKKLEFDISALAPGNYYLGHHVDQLKNKRFNFTIAAK